MCQSMKSYDLGFISDDQIRKHVLDTVQKYRFSIGLKEFNKNIIDPIKLTFDAKVYDKSLKDIIENEVLRQIDKSNNNHIGYFHQNIFKYLGKGWIVPSSGYDIINEDKKIFVEMKNKHNTMNSSSSQKTYMRMQNILLQDKNATCMLVEIISKKSQNTVWNIKLDGKTVSNERIRRVSIDQFYTLVTGDAFAFKKLCEQLPVILSDVIGSKKGISNTVFEELLDLSPDLIKSLYLLSFQKYEGFDDFKM